MKIISFIGILLMFLVSPARAGCESGQTQYVRTQSEMNHCADQALKAADRKLNLVYGAAIKAMKSFDGELQTNQKGAEKALRKAQRAWIMFRNSSCQLAGFEERGGTVESMLVTLCHEQMTKVRTIKLKQLVVSYAN